MAEYASLFRPTRFVGWVERSETHRGQRITHVHDGYRSAQPILHVVRSPLLPQPHAGLVAVGEDDAALLQRAPDLVAGLRTPTKLAAFRFQPANGRFRYSGAPAEFILRPAQQSPGGFYLRD